MITWHEDDKTPEDFDQSKVWVDERGALNYREPASTSRKSIEFHIHDGHHGKELEIGIDIDDPDLGTTWLTVSAEDVPDVLTALQVWIERMEGLNT